MRLRGIGTLTPEGDCWLVVYDRCGHRQVLAREGLEDDAQAARDIRRYYAECLTCSLAARLGGPGSRTLRQVAAGRMY